MQANFSDIFGFGTIFYLLLLIIVFTYFYTAITVPTNKMSDDLKRSGGFIPGISPGNETSEYLDTVMSYITFPGSLFLAIIAVFPAIVVQMNSTRMGSFLWRYFTINYGRRCHRHNSAGKFLLA